MDYTSSEFDIQKIADYTLLVHVGETQHHLAVVDDEGTMMLLTLFEDGNIHSQAADLLNSPFGRVRVACRQHAYTFVPDEVYDESQLGNYASFVSAGLEAEQVAVSNISSIGVRNVYGVEPLAFHYFTNYFPHAMVIPDSSVLLQVTGGKLAKKQGIYLGIDLHESRLALYCFDKGQFLFYNNFEVADENDFNYHLLNVVRGLGMSWDNIQCMLSGQIMPQDAHYKVLTKYTDRIEFADTARMARVTLPENMEKHQHTYLVLMGLYACES